MSHERSGGRFLEMISAGLLGGLLLGLPRVTMAAPPSKPKLLVQDLEGRGVGPGEVSALSVALCMEVSRRKEHDVLCGDDLRSLMQFGALVTALDGCKADACQVSLGKALEARFVVSGTVARLGQPFVLSLALYDAPLARAVRRSQVKAATLEKLHGAVAEAVEDLFKPPPP